MLANSQSTVKNSTSCILQGNQPLTGSQDESCGQQIKALVKLHCEMSRVLAQITDSHATDNELNSKTWWSSWASQPSFEFQSASQSHSLLTPHDHSLQHFTLGQSSSQIAPIQPSFDTPPLYTPTLQSISPIAQPRLQNKYPPILPGCSKDCIGAEKCTEGSQLVQLQEQIQYLLATQKDQSAQIQSLRQEVSLFEVERGHYLSIQQSNKDRISLLSRELDQARSTQQTQLESQRHEYNSTMQRHSVSMKQSSLQPVSFERHTATQNLIPQTTYPKLEVQPAINLKELYNKQAEQIAVLKAKIKNGPSTARVLNKAAGSDLGVEPHFPPHELGTLAPVSQDPIEISRPQQRAMTQSSGLQQNNPQVIQQASQIIDQKAQGGIDISTPLPLPVDLPIPLSFLGSTPAPNNLFPLPIVPCSMRQVNGLFIDPKSSLPRSPSAASPPRTEKAPPTSSSSSTDDTSANSPRQPQVQKQRLEYNYAVQRNLKLPKFKGTESVRGFFIKFEILTRKMGASSCHKKALVVSTLEGAADHWLMGQQEDWEPWSYETLKDRMVKYFGEESRISSRKLKAFKQGSQNMSTYSDKFKELAATATSHLTTMSIKDLFLENMHNQDLAHQLRLVSDQHSLQSLSLLALEMEYYIQN